MRARKLTRLGVLEQHIEQLPFRTGVLEESFQRFRSTGELPEVRRLAAGVVRRALRPCDLPPIEDPAAFLKELEQQWYEYKMRHPHWQTEGSQTEGQQPVAALKKTLTVRERLFHEAVHCDDIGRAAARAVLQWEVANGGDVTDPEFLADCTLPKHNSVGLHLLGLPECLAIAPYEAQAHRMMKRIDDVRERVDHNDPQWFLPIDVAIRAFAATGQLPAPGLVRDAVLAATAMNALILHMCGDDVSGRMAALDAVAG